MQEAHAISKVLHGEDAVPTSYIEANLGHIYRRMGKHEEADKWYRSALTTCEKQLKPNHYDRLSVKMNMGANLCAQGRYEEALKQLVWVKKRHDEQNKTHPKAALNVALIGDVQLAMGNVAAAVQSYRDADSIYCHESNAGTFKEHNEIAWLATQLGIALARGGEIEEAMSLFDKAMDINELVFGKEHPTREVVKTAKAKAEQAARDPTSQHAMVRMSAQVASAAPDVAPAPTTPTATIAASWSDTVLGHLLAAARGVADFLQTASAQERTRAKSVAFMLTADLAEIALPGRQDPASSATLFAADTAGEKYVAKRSNRFSMFSKRRSGKAAGRQPQAAPPLHSAPVEQLLSGRL